MNPGRWATLIAFGVAAALLVLGALLGLYQWHLSAGRAATLLCILAGLLLLIGAIFFWLVTGQQKTATVVMEGQVVLGTGAGLMLILWGQVFIALGFIAAWRLLYPPKQSLPITPGVTVLPAISDLVQLVQALTVAPTWLGMTAVGVALTFVGAWVIRRSRTAAGN